jgi:hypothetical protein
MGPNMKWAYLRIYHPRLAGIPVQGGEASSKSDKVPNPFTMLADEEKKIRQELWKTVASGLIVWNNGSKAAKKGHWVVACVGFNQYFNQGLLR